MKRTLFLLLILILSNIFCCRASADEEDGRSRASLQSVEGKVVLIITSYSVDSKSTADNLAAFTDKYNARGGQLRVVVENMGCRELSEMHLWKGRMAKILRKYQGASGQPAMVILLGREAVSAYFSQDGEFARQTPVMVGSCTSTAVILPDDSVSTVEWMPESKLLRRDFPDFNIIGGVVTHFDLSKNIELIKSIYPGTRKVAFVTDNTLGGVTMQAVARAEYTKHMGVDLEYIDGRRITFDKLRDSVKNIPNDTKLLLGTWRVDSTEKYVLQDTPREMHKANPHLPVFSLSSSGIGGWALGGYIPDFQIVGDRLADMCIEFIDGSGNPGIIFLDSHYNFDYQIVRALALDKDMLPRESRFVNEPQSFFETHKRLVIGVVGFFSLLIIMLMVALYYIHRLRVMKRALTKRGEELMVARDKAEEANRMKSAFLANISHEIRTPLNSIVGFSNLITSKEMDIDESEKSRFGDIIRENSDILLQLINDVLDISKMDSENFTMAMGKHDIVKMSAMAVESMAVTCKKPVEFKFNCNVKSMTVNTDETSLRQVINNLFSNSIKFTDRGSVTLDLMIEEDNQMARFTVTDTGSGIPKDKADKVFERFVKLNDFKQGTGLGLPICKQIVRKLGGDIWVDTSYTGGARFVFTHSLVL